MLSFTMANRGSAVRQRIRPVETLAVLLVAVYFLALTSEAAGAYFSPDDSMNLYRSWSFSTGELVKANFLFFLNSPFVRPLGSVWYRSIFALAGFHPIPFHVALLVTLAANVWLTYCVTRRLTGSREAGVLAAIFIAYHPKFANLYFDTGYIYDVLCYFFYFAAFLYYLRIGQRQEPPTWRQLAICGVLYICALNSKEMAVTLPALLLVYELLYGSGGQRPVQRFRGVLVIASITLLFAAGRARSQDSLLSVGPYQPVFTWSRWMETSGNFLSQLFLREEAPSSGLIVSLWIALLAIAWWAKSKPLQLASLFIVFSPIPVAFIAPRGAAQYYVPFFGWALYASVALVGGSERLVALAAPAESVLRRVRAPLLAGSLALVSYCFYRDTGWPNAPSVVADGEGYRSLVEQVHKLQPSLRPHSRVLFLADPIRPRWHNLTFLMRLLYRDDGLTIGRANSMDAPPDAKRIASYDYVFDYRNGRFFNGPQPPEPPRAPGPAFGLDFNRPAFFHSDWTPVTRHTPVKGGEVVLARALDLGETNPPTPRGQLFPASPLLPVITPVRVQVGGREAEVVSKIAWPEMADTYRLDFRVPTGLPGGVVAVTIESAGVTGPPALLMCR